MTRKDKKRESRGVHEDGKFTAATDYRKRRVKGLQIRNGKYYAQLWVELPNGKKSARRFALLDEEGEPCTSVVKAQASMDALRHKLKSGKAAAIGKKPNLEAAVAEYLESQSYLSKAPETRSKESRCLEFWVDRLGPNARLETIGKQHVANYKECRLKGGLFAGTRLEPAHPRTAQIDMLIFRNFLKYAEERNWIAEIPSFPKWRRMEIPKPPKRSLLDPNQFNTLIESCSGHKNGPQMKDLLLLLAYSGAREQEALSLRWPHVDFKNEVLHIGADENFKSGSINIGVGGDTKTGVGREIEFNPQLKAHLKEMNKRRAPDSEWLFPSPQRGTKDQRITNFRATLSLVRSTAKLTDFSFHDLRHLFISYCVMGGIPIMTIARWVGHKDGGVLIGKTYGHLLKEHLVKQAAKVKIAIS